MKEKYLKKEVKIGNCLLMLFILHLFKKNQTENEA